jgi:GntR family transcriptional regulator, transcriptional repressor for pyruvate dehydrogenase complex
MFLPVENREPISKIIADQIERAIITRVYEPGTKIPSEHELCRQFGVSRTSVREALKSLNAHGLIEIIKGKGMFVLDVNSDSVSDPLEKYLKLKLDRNYVLDLVHARQIIEPGIAYYAALNRTGEDIRQLQKDIEELDLCCGGVVDFARLDMTFHLHLAKASQNSVIPLILDPIHRLIPEVSSVYAAVEDAREIAQEWHMKILKAVIEKNAEKARKSMIEHLKIAETHAEKMLQAKII